MLDQGQLNALYQYGLSLTADEMAAEDLLQSAIERLLKVKPRPKNVFAYTRKIIRNQFIDDCRRKKIIDFEPLEDHAPMLLDEHDLEKVIIDQAIIQRLVAQLGNAEREVLFLWAVAGFTANEIAKEIDAPRGTVLARLYRIKQKCQDYDEQYQIRGGGN